MTPARPPSLLRVPREWWLARAPRERRLLALAAAMLALALYVALVWSATLARAPLRADVAALRAQAAGLQRQAAELARLRATPAPTVSGTDLRALVQSRLDGSPLAGGLARLDAPDAEHVVVAFTAVGFTDWLQWVEGLQALQVRLEACRIEPLGPPGSVTITATLVRAAPP